MGSELFSVRNQSIGCAVAWVTIARDSESECPFCLVGQFCRMWAGHLFSPFLKVGGLCDNCFLNHSIVFTDGCDGTNVDGVKSLGKSNVDDINFMVYVHHVRHHFLEDQQIGEAGPTG